MGMVNRLHTIFKYAKNQNVRVMVDAEQSYFQPAIHRLAVEMMRSYNTESAIVFNTQQCYLKKALKTVTLDLEQAKRQNFYYGAKLVQVSCDWSAAAVLSCDWPSRSEPAPSCSA